jgi:hypothetical protein
MIWVTLPEAFFGESNCAPSHPISFLELSRMWRVKMQMSLLLTICVRPFPLLTKVLLRRVVAHLGRLNFQASVGRKVMDKVLRSAKADSWGSAIDDVNASVFDVAAFDSYRGYLFPR